MAGFRSAAIGAYNASRGQLPPARAAQPALERKCAAFSEHVRAAIETPLVERGAHVPLLTPRSPQLMGLASGRAAGRRRGAYDQDTDWEDELDGADTESSWMAVNSSASDSQNATASWAGLDRRRVPKTMVAYR